MHLIIIVYRQKLSGTLRNQQEKIQIKYKNFNSFYSKLLILSWENNYIKIRFFKIITLITDDGSIIIEQNILKILYTYFRLKK